MPPLTNDQIVAKHAFLRKGMFLTGGDFPGVCSGLTAPRYGDPPRPDSPSLDEIAQRLRKAAQMLEDIKAGKL